MKIIIVLSRATRADCALQFGAVALAALAARGQIDKSELARYAPQLPHMDLFGKAHFMQAATSLGVDDQELVDLSKTILSFSVQSGGKFQFNEERLVGSEAMLQYTYPQQLCDPQQYSRSSRAIIASNEHSW